MNSSETRGVLSGQLQNGTGTMHNMSESEVQRILDELDLQFAGNVIPVFIFLGLLVVFGALGNVLVLVVYLRKFKPSPNRVFILALAAVDLLTCALAIPGDMVDLRHNYHHPSTAFCRIDTLLTAFCGLASGNILLVVGVHRYRKICCPQRRQLGRGAARKLVGGCLLVCALLTWPAGILYGRRTIETPVPGVEGRACTIDNAFVESLLPLLYNGLLFVVFCGALSALITLYTLIWCKVKKSTKRLKATSTLSNPIKIQVDSMENQQRLLSQYTANASTENLADSRTSPVDSSTKPAQYSEILPGKSSTEPVLRQEDSGIVKDLPDVQQGSDGNQDVCGAGEQVTKTCVGSEGSGATKAGTEDSDALGSETARKCTFLTPSSVQVSSPVSVGKTPPVFGSKERFASLSVRSLSSALPKDSTHRASKRVTFMMFLISLVFILSYLPHLVLVIAREVHKELFGGHQGSGVVAFNLFLRSFYIQSMANPIIYGLYNKDFRSACKGLLKCLFGRCFLSSSSSRGAPRAVFYDTAVSTTQHSLSQTMNSE